MNIYKGERKINGYTVLICLLSAVPCLHLFKNKQKNLRLMPQVSLVIYHLWNRYRRTLNTSNVSIRLKEINCSPSV